MMPILLLRQFNGLFPKTTCVSRYQKGKTSLDLNEARQNGVLGWQRHQLDHMQTICTSFRTDNHTNTSSLNFTDRMLFLTSNQQCQSTEDNNAHISMTTIKFDSVKTLFCMTFNGCITTLRTDVKRQVYVQPHTYANKVALPAFARRCCSNRWISNPPGPQQQTRRTLLQLLNAAEGRMDEQTGGRTPYRFIDPAIEGGAYWAGQAAARPLFGSCGPPLSLARPLFGVM